jgi:tryptophan-rich sensory protein
VLFWRRDTLAGVLFVPYLAWVTFATALTIAVWRRNPTLL